MKIKIMMAALLAAGTLLAGCSGDQTPKKVTKDTVQNTYHTKDTAKVDTSKTTSPDNSANGGSTAVKDTAKK